MLSALVIWGCSDSKTGGGSEYLIRVGGHTASVADFYRTLEITKSAYPHNAIQNSEVAQAIKLRVLDQMIEEMVLMVTAERLNIYVSDEELETAVKNFKQDYPEGVFEDLLLENAVSYETWVERLKMRLLMEKVITGELEANIAITPEDMAACYEEYCRINNLDPKSVENSESVNRNLIRMLRKKKAESMYEKWIAGIREGVDLEVNEAQWRKIIGKTVTPHVKEKTAIPVSENN